MHDDLTAQDIAMMQKELDHRKLELMPELIEEVKRTRALNTRPQNRHRTATAAVSAIWNA